MNSKTMNQQIQKTSNKALYHFSLSTLTGFILMLLSGNLMAAQDTGYDITSPTSGVVKTIYITMGKTVNKGDLLLEFDDTLIASNLSEAKANIKLARLNRAEAKKELERAEELYERTVLSEHDLQLAKVSYAKAQAQYAAAENKLVQAQWDVKHSKLYATFKGNVIKVFTYPGQFVNNRLQAQPLFIINK